MYTVEFLRDHFVMYSMLWASGFTAGYAIRLVAQKIRESSRGDIASA
jgi:uncharacterized protein YoaH (UPF0181 family)